MFSRRSDTSIWPLLFLLLAATLLIPLDRPLLGLSLITRLVLGGTVAILFLFFVINEPIERRRRYLGLALCIAILVIAPIDTSLELGHMIVLGFAFAAVLVIPAWLLRGSDDISFKLLPNRLDLLDVVYTIASVPLAWGAFALYFGLLNPEAPFNWKLPPVPEGSSILKLFLGINAVGVWDELFFINTCFALLRSLFPYRIANPAQAVIYTVVLYDMAFSGWGPLFVGILALTQGAMFERSKVLIWVLIVHLIVDYFLFQGIIAATYPDMSVWWHP
ncbi:MAG: hypothetical protein JSV66_03700 [Trueperaceae bacterium]|nr:MAG: hypothetical protein JSV66_03700 [Trueperaceae bacterium]